MQSRIATYEEEKTYEEKESESPDSGPLHHPAVKLVLT